MADTLAKLQRLRDRQRKAATLELARAQRAEAQQAERLAENRQRLERAQPEAESLDPAELARYHAFRLRMEVARRHEQTRLENRSRDVAVRQDKLVEAMREVRVVERIQEIRAEEKALEDRRAEDAALDEVGLLSWFRRSA